MRGSLPLPRNCRTVRKLLKRKEGVLRFGDPGGDRHERWCASPGGSGECRVARSRVGRGCDTPAVFVRVANTGVTGAEAVRVAGKGLKVDLFSVSCGRRVRVANKGLTEAFCLQKSNWAGPDGFGGVRRTA